MHTRKLKHLVYQPDSEAGDYWCASGSRFWPMTRLSSTRLRDLTSVLCMLLRWKLLPGMRMSLKHNSQSYFLFGSGGGSQGCPQRNFPSRPRSSFLTRASCAANVTLQNVSRAWQRWEVHLRCHNCAGGQCHSSRTGAVFRYCASCHTRLNVQDLALLKTSGSASHIYLFFHPESIPAKMRSPTNCCKLRLELLSRPGIPP